MIDLFNYNEKKENDYEIVRDVKLLYNNKKVEKKLFFKEIDYETAKEIIINNHYSHKWNTAFGKINIGVYEKDKLLGVASFGNLMNPKSYKKFNKDFEQKNVIELNRLWIDDLLGGNAETVLLKASFDIIKKKYSYIKAVQSFADGRLGVGTIYKAMSFKYYGFSKTLFFEHTSGENYHNVPMDNTMRPDGMIKLNTMFVNGELKPFYVKTYRYIYVLDKKTKINIDEKKYPKYEKGKEYAKEYVKNDKSTIRAFILAYILNYEKEKEDLYKYIKGKKIENMICEQLENTSIIKIKEKRNAQEKYEELKTHYEIDYCKQYKREKGE
jgi:hypothetical protein